MTGTLEAEKQVLPWILCLLLITVAGEEVPCPIGSQIHLSSVHCYWMSEATSSWSAAQLSCRGTPGGDLASADSPELQAFIHYSFPVTTTRWVWLRGEGPEEAGVVEPVSPAGGERGCTQMALGAQGQRRRAQCAGRHLYLCEKALHEELPPLDGYLTGLVHMSGIYTQTQIQPLLGVPDVGQHTVEMQLFPGLWFSHAGQLVNVKLVVRPSPLSSLARVQILRPYCDPSHHLVPPGCSSLLNPFSCCSPVPLCNTTGGCSAGHYWCHLLEACVPYTSPCSPYDSAASGRGFTLPPRYPAMPPFYHLVADLSLRIDPSSELKTTSVLLPDAAIMVYPDDIIAIQHTRDPGTFLRCRSGEASRNSSWRQSYLSLGGGAWGGWWQGGLTSLSQGGQWVDGVVCDLSVQYTDTPHRGTELDGVLGFTPPGVSPLTPAPPDPRFTFRLSVIHPPPDHNNQIHVKIDTPTLIVVKVLSAQRARSSWSAPVLQSGVPFLPACPEEVAPSEPGCERQSPDEWFTSASLSLPSAGVQSLDISVADQSVSVKVCGYEAVAGLSVEPDGRLRMLTGTSQSFTAKVKSGSSVTFTWVVDNLEQFAFEGDSYSVAFKRPAEYKLKVTASNPVSSQSLEISLMADEVTPLAEPEFLSVREVVAVNATHLYTLRVKVDISLPVTFRWDFGDGSGAVSRTQAAPCQTMNGLVESGEKQVFVQDSVNYTYSNPGDLTLRVRVSNQFDDIGASVEIIVRSALGLVHVTSHPAVPTVNRTLLLEAAAEPSAFGVFYGWDFGDGSEGVRGVHRTVRHTFASAGLRNVTVCANNTMAALMAWLVLDVMEEISGLTVSYGEPSEANSATDFRAEVATGTSLVWDFDFGDGSLQGNLTNGSISHVYKSPGNYTVVVAVSNSVSRAQQSIRVEVYTLAVSGVLPVECIANGTDTQLTALVTGKISTLIFHWQFGDGSPVTVVTGRSTARHAFPRPGVFHASLTVLSSASAASFNASVCVEAPITAVAVRPSRENAAAGEEVCFGASVSPEQATGYRFKWSSSSFAPAAKVDNSQKCFVCKDEGVTEVSVIASNNVSSQTAKASVTIQKAVGKLSVGHDGQSDTLAVNSLVSFWVANCSGSNVSVLWDFGDGSPTEQSQEASHVFTSTGQFTVTAAASNLVSRESASVQVNVLLPVADLSLHSSQPYAAVGEEVLITAAGSAIGSTSYYWAVDGLTSTQQGTRQFRFAFPRPGVYQVRVVAQNLVSRREAAISIEVLEQIEGLHVDCPGLTGMKYAPTREELLCVASVAKGSNVTYRWLAAQSGMNPEVSGDGRLFHLCAETPGGLSVRVRASNMLGEAAATVSLAAVERATGARVTTRSNIVASGKLVNISVSVVTGSDLEYLWYLSFDPSPLRTREPFLLHNFTSLGDGRVTAVVQNVLSRCNDTKQLTVQEDVQEVDFDIEGTTRPFYISATAAVSLRGRVRKGSDLRWDWEVRRSENNIFNATNQTFVYTFTNPDVYQVSLNVSNGINWQVVSHRITVQDGVEDLQLNISKSSLCSEEEVAFTPTISKGSNVSFVITLKNEDWIHSQAAREGQSSSLRLPPGRYVVTAEAWNLVSRTEASSSVLVTERIRGLRLTNGGGPAALEALKGIHFKAEVQSGFPVSYAWMFRSPGSKPARLIGQEVVFTPPGSGLLTISVVADNGVCSQMLNQTASVDSPVKGIKLVCLSERIFVGHAVVFSAVVSGGSSVGYLWDFGDSTEALVTDSRTVNHTYYIAGKYSVVAEAVNSVSHGSAQLHVEAEELRCPSPQASLVQSQSTIYRSRTSLFEASVDINCSVYKTVYQWEIFRGSNLTGLSENQVFLQSQVDAASPLLFLPRNTLDVGQYRLVFTATLQETPVFVRRAAVITVVGSPLVAAIKGGSRRLWPSLSDLTLDGSESHDPDTEPGVEDALEYRWSLVRASSTESHFVKQPIESSHSRVTLFSDQLHPGTVYIVTLTVHKAGRKPASVNQTVTVCEAPVLHVTVECVSCYGHSSSQHVSYNGAVILAGRCEQCDDQTEYEWSAEVQAGVTLDLDGVAPSTGTHSPDLVMRSGVLQPGLSYTFTLNVSQPGGGLWGSAGQTVIPNSPPHGGLCDLRPEAGVRLLETVVTYNCSGWRGDDNEASQLIYTFQVAPCQPISTECPTLTLYRGTRSTFGSLVPMGRPGQETKLSLITLTVLVEDHLGSNVVALNRTLTIENPEMKEITSEWLRNKSRTELWALVQHGNPQELVPYSLALTSQLNQMVSERSPQELGNRREIRANVSRALASLPVSSLLDVDRISSALAQATAVPDESVCEGCQEKVLEAVGKMILVMEQQTSPGVSSALETGRDILHVLGSTLAAVSGSAGASGSHPAYSSSLRPASALALSALAHAGALVRTLMHSRARGEGPLLLSTPYINTVGFQGDPTDLLCAHRTHQSDRHRGVSSRSETCPFHIPASLAAHLRSQRPEVVQVLLGTDGALESNPMLTAADPPISTSLVAMELTTPQGRPIPIRNLAPEQAIQVTLPNKYRVGQGDKGGGGRGGGHRNETCLSVTLPTEGQLNFTVKAVAGLNENAGLYISFNFSLLPGAAPVSSGYVKIEVSSTGPGTNASLEKEWALALPAPTTYSEETIFLSPLLRGTGEPLSVNLTSSVAGGGAVRASVCVFSSLCQYYSVKERRWSSEGLQPLEGSTLQAAHCLTRHLTIFGASLFVHPGAVVLLPPSGGPIRNSVVGIVCAVLVLTHLLVGLIAHKLDHLDSLRLSQVPLCGRPGLHHYRVLVKTGRRRGAGTTAHVGISLHGVNKSGSRHLQRDGAFQRGGLDQFHLETDDNLGEVWKIRIWHDNTGLDPSWYVQHVVVWDPHTDHMFFFLLEDWLSVDNQKNETVEKEVLASCPEELSGFRRVLASQLMFGVIERHLWLSLWERPAHSRFTRGQRVTCGALVLHLYLALGALWFGAVGSKGISGPVSAQQLVNMETVAMGMTVAALVFPLQCFLCFLFRKAHSQVTVDMSVPPSPVCHSVEMDVYFGQSKLSSSSLLSLPDSSSPTRESPSSLLESKVFDSSILDFWAASGLAPQTDRDVVAWPSCDSLLNLPVDLCPTKMAPAKFSATLGPTRQLRRKKALMQLCLSSPSSPDTPVTPVPTSHQYPSPTAADREVHSMNANPVRAHNHNLTTYLTLSEEDLLMSIAAGAEDTTHGTNSGSDSGQDSPRTTSSFTATQSTSCSSWSDQSEDRSLCGAEILMPDSQCSQYEAGPSRCPSVLSVDSVASTFLPSPSPESTRCSSVTRIGVSRGQPGWLLPPWTLRVIYPLVAALLAACLAAVGLYGTSFPRSVVLAWLVSAFSAFLTSALLLEPLKVCVQALIYAVLWRPVDPEVEEQLAQDTTVVRAFGERSAKVRPPCGYGLLQAKDEARKVRALRSLMRHCVCQLFFLLLVLMVNYQDSAEERQGRLLQSALRGHLHTAPSGAPNLTSLRDWSDAERWLTRTLVPQLHHHPSLRLAGLPRLRYAGAPGRAAAVLLGNGSERTCRLLADLHMADRGEKMFKTLSIDFTHYNRDSGLFVCVSIQLQRAQTHRITPSLSIHPLLLLSPSSGLDLRVALTVLLLLSALLLLFSELFSVVTERAQYLHDCRLWFQLLLALLSLATAVLQFCFLSHASSCVSELRNQPDNFINFHRGALLAQRSSQCAAVLLTLLVLKLLGTLRFARRWLLIGRVLQRGGRELLALAVLLLLLLLLCAHLGNVLFCRSAEGFQSVHEAAVSVLSLLRSRVARRRLCKAHAVLGPLYGLLLTGGALWLLARLCGAVLIRAYRAEQAELYCPTIEPQDYEMVEFFIKRLKLWMGLSKAKEFRHSVKFEGMDAPPSRSSQESRLSALSSALPSYRSPSPSSSSFSSPRPLSSVLSARSEDSSVSEPGFDVSPYLDRLLPGVAAVLSNFDRVNRITEDVHNLEMKLEEAQTRRRRRRRIGNDKQSAERFEESTTNPEEPEAGMKTGDIRHKRLLHPKPRVSLPSSFSFNLSTLHSSAAPTCVESDSVSHQASRDNHSSAAAKSASGVCGWYPAGAPGFGELPRRRAWHSGSSHSADAAQRAFLFSGGAPPFGNGGGDLTNDRPRSEEGVKRRISDGVPVKRKAWISEGPEAEQD